MFPGSNHPVLQAWPSSVTKAGASLRALQTPRRHEPLAPSGTHSNSLAAPGPQFTHLSRGKELQLAPAPPMPSPTPGVPKRPQLMAASPHLPRTARCSALLRAAPALPPPARPRGLKGSNPSPPALRPDYTRPPPGLRPSSSPHACKQPLPRRCGPWPLAR